MRIEITEEEKKSLLHWINTLLNMMNYDIKKIENYIDNPFNGIYLSDPNVIISGYREQIAILESFLVKVRSDDDGK